MVASPTDLAVTRPFSTTTTSSSEDCHVTALLVVDSGVTTAVNFSLVPIVIVAGAPEISIPVAITGLTVISAKAVTPDPSAAVATTVAVPGFTAVKVLPSNVKTSVPS